MADRVLVNLLPKEAILALVERIPILPVTTMDFLHDKTTGFNNDKITDFNNDKIMDFHPDKTMASHRDRITAFHPGKTVSHLVMIFDPRLLPKESKWVIL
jgi:hypothetical protein